MNVENNEAEQSINDSPDNADVVNEQEQTDEGAATGEKGGEVRRYWLYSLGEDNDNIREQNWKYCLEHEVMIIGYGKSGDLRKLGNTKISEAVNKNYPGKTGKGLGKFLNEMKKKDGVFARKGKYIVGRGVIDSDYDYDKDQEYGHQRKVKWERRCLNENGEEMPDDIYSSAVRKTLMEIKSEDQLEKLKELVKSDSFHDVNPADGQNNEDEGQEAKAEEAAQEEREQEMKCKLEYSRMLLDSKNMILHGAPGTGKTYLAKQIAADIVSNGRCTDYEDLSVDEKKQIEFVQFHPNYDYSDFVEGLRPIMKDGTLGFELKKGIFKKFIDSARENFEDDEKSNEKEVREQIEEYLKGCNDEKLKLKRGNSFIIENYDENKINIFIPGNNELSNQVTLRVKIICDMLKSDRSFPDVSAVKEFFNRSYSVQDDSYYFIIYRKVKKIMEQKSPAAKAKPERTTLKKYVFIIDEINRGEISKIFGELFFSIDPGYRGRAGEISTQFSNMHDENEEKFYIPENVYIIGTMNDIDRSVDSLDFAMRRRFRFVELKANKHIEMLNALGDRKAEAIKRMEALNKAIAEVDGLNDNYQIGAAYFLKLKTPNFTFEMLWEDYLQPLLQEYIHGMYDEKKIMDRFKDAFYLKKSAEGESDEQGNS